MKRSFLPLAVFASFAMLGALSAPGADTPTPPAIGFQPDSQQDLVGFVILAMLGCSIAALVIWQLWQYFSPGSGDRSTRFQSAYGYIRSNCRFCGGSIEFPEHGLGERVDCPHCNRRLQLRRMGVTERWLVGVRVWCREGGFDWRWVLALTAVVLVCGTALCIYLGWRREVRAQAGQRFEQEARQKETERRNEQELRVRELQQQVEHQLTNDPVFKQAQAISEDQRVTDLAIETWSPYWEKHHSNYPGDMFVDFLRLKSLLGSGLTPDAARSQLEYDLEKRRDAKEVKANLEGVKAELRRANDLAEQASFQSRLDKIREDNDRRSKEIDREYQQRIKEINRLYANPQMQQTAPPTQYPSQNQDWILRYNPYSGLYQYAPPNAQLKYNGFQNRWEWVP